MAFVDADVRLRSDTLIDVVGKSLSDSVGAAYACPIAESTGIGGRLDASVTSFGAFLIQPLFAALDIDPLAGSLWTTRRRVLEDIGGFASIADYFADDIFISQRLRANGYRVAFSRQPVLTVTGRRGLHWFIEHQTRWLRTWRLMPGANGYLTLFFSPVAIASLALVIEPSWWEAVLLLSCLEAGVGWFVERTLNRSARPVRSALILPFALLGEQLIAIYALFGQNVLWAGRRYKLDRGGRFSEQA
jgi:cellulose synthase/poly-beta-1,6-N-acetylglucosamine synthase-like glycosyltransferase